MLELQPATWQGPYRLCKKCSQKVDWKNFKLPEIRLLIALGIDPIEFEGAQKMPGWAHSSEAAAVERLRKRQRGNMRTDLKAFTRQLVNFIADSLKEAITEPEWRAAAIDEAKISWGLLNRRLARKDAPQELQKICARLALLFEFEDFPAVEDEDVETKLRNLIEQIDGLDMGAR